MSDGAPLVSVIIPVRDDSARLARCLSALAAQSLQPPSFEAVVVDNGSRDDPAAVVMSHPWARLVREPEPSSYRARNRGVAAARGDILAFTDSDCVPTHDWLERGCATVRAAGDRAFVAGRVDVFPRDPAAPNAVELYELAHAFRQQRYAERDGFGATANVLVRRDVFDRVGPFSADLASSGDLEWGQRAREAGVRAVYADEVRVAHPARSSLAAIGRKARRIQEGESQLRRLRGQRPIGLDALRLLMPPIPTLVRTLPRVRPRPWHARLRYAGATVAAHYILAYERLRVAVRRSAT